MANSLTDRILLALVGALVVAGLVFGLWPGLDIAATRAIYDGLGFFGVSETARDARDTLRLAPFWLLGGLIGLRVLRLRFAVPAPTLRAIVFLVSSLVIGAGLIVNLGLKEHSHRPRPVHIVEFGGDQEFRPWWKFDGACKRNCSFASGEAASGFWTIAPALLAPPPWQAAALAVAVVFGLATSALRVAFGGHFVSDVVAGGLISAITVFALWRFLFGRRL